MDEENAIRRSKFLSLILRHQPEKAGIRLDEAGWVHVRELLEGCTGAGQPLTREELDHIVTTNSKKRFEFSQDGTYLRASQGHSVAVDLQYAPRTPPDLLYHGTASRFADGIRTSGLQRMQRHHVHLSAETKVTLEVGARRGKPILLTILAGDMHRAGYLFQRTTNGVWLVDHVPSQYIRFPDEL